MLVEAVVFLPRATVFFVCHMMGSSDTEDCEFLQGHHEEEEFSNGSIIGSMNVHSDIISSSKSTHSESAGQDEVSVPCNSSETARV